MRRTRQQSCAPGEFTICDEYGRHLLVDDVDNPSTTAADKPFDWICGRQVGGRTLMWGRQSYRLSDYEFKAASRAGREELCVEPLQSDVGGKECIRDGWRVFCCAGLPESDVDDDGADGAGVRLFGGAVEAARAINLSR